MHLKIFLLCALFLIHASADDSPDTTNIVIANWTFVSTQATAQSPCCQPTGNLSIIGNPNYTITLTSTNWTGAECNDRNSSFQDVIDLNWTYSFTQLQGFYDQGNFIPVVYDNNDTELAFDMSFGPPTTITWYYNVQQRGQCVSSFQKSGWIVRVFMTTLVGFVALILV